MEQATDKYNYIASCRSREEIRLFNEVKETLNVKEKFSTPSPLKFSYDSRKRGIGQNLAKLDRVYTFCKNGEVVTSVDYRILGDYSHFDHLPIWKQFWLEPDIKKSSLYIMRNLYLGESMVKI